MYHKTLDETYIVQKDVTTEWADGDDATDCPEMLVFGSYLQMNWEVWFKMLVHTGWWEREKERDKRECVCVCRWLGIFGCFELRQSRAGGNLWGGGRLTSNLANVSAAVWQPTAYTTPNSIEHGCECLPLHNWRFLGYCFYDHSCVTLKSMNSEVFTPPQIKTAWPLVPLNCALLWGKWMLQNRSGCIY